MAVAAAWIVAPLMLGWMFFGARGQRADLGVAIEEARQDSARFAQVIESNATLKARQDSIAEKLEIIQQIDAGRYVWPHVLDEVARALPEYTWLTDVTQTAGGPLPTFRLEGRTGTTFALTSFLQSLEGSPFVRDVRFESTEQVFEDERRLYEFTIAARYEEPASDLIETVPVFSGEDDVEPALVVADERSVAGAAGGR
ncbi:MAG: PilN domain-containing protein [Gemmatimonadota bacterium]